MKITSDETPKQNRFSDWLKKHKVSEISRTIAFIILGVAGVIWLFVTIMNANEKGKSVLREHEKEDVEKIITHKPVIKCFEKYYLPEEYELEVVKGRNTLKIFYPQRNLNTGFLLSNCDLILTKTRLSVTDNFREAVFKKRGFVSAKSLEEQRLQNELMVKESEAKEALELKKSLEIEHIVPENDETKPKSIVVSEATGAIHSADYYLKLEYATLYPALVQATKDLKEYHQTDEYKLLKQKRFGQNQTTRTLNRAYNSVHGKMWKLHNRFGIMYGTYKQLEEGKLIVSFINGSLEFMGDV